MTPTSPRHPREASHEWKLRLATILAQPENQENPLRSELEELANRHERLLARLDKIARISDGFQGQLKALNQALAEASRTDALTGLPNRRSMMERLKAELARTEREKAPMSVIMADVDFFKEINDTHGHEAGDKALQLLAATMRDTLRQYDSCARWGGEEFLFLLPGTDAPSALVVAEKLQERLALTPIAFENISLHLTLSLGVAERRPGEELTQLVSRADTALYTAKHHGRNRTELAP